MARRTSPKREKTIAMMLRHEVGEWCISWLQKAGMTAKQLGDLRRFHGYKDAGGPEPVIAFLAGATDQECDAHFAMLQEQRRAWRSRRWEAQAEWLTRHVLSPNSPELVVPKELALATRARLLAKLRDEMRRAKKFRTIRIDAETAEWLDALVRHKGLGSRSEAVEMMVRVVMETFGGETSVKD